MNNEIKEQMNRYPVFSCNDMTFTDESDLFRDEQIHSKTKKSIHQSYLSHHKKKNQTIISIYDRISNNNESDPLYPKRHKSKNNYSTATSARQSKPQIETLNKQPQAQFCKNNKTLTRFVGQFAKSISHDTSHPNDFHKLQKISLLRRIIDHYNIKSVQKKYYSNLIKTFGLKIESFNSTELAVKKDLHPRINPKLQQQQKQQSQKLQQQSRKRLPTRKFKQTNSFTISKQSPNLQISKQSPNLQISKQLFESSQKKNRIKNIRTSKCQSRNLIRKSIQIPNKRLQGPFKMQNCNNNIENKINKYRDFLFVLNMSNHLYRNLDIQQYQKPFKYYVGKGNNGNLIKSLMKKRFWFEETNNPSQANYLWTQIKLQQILDKQEIGIRKIDIQTRLIIQNNTEQTEQTSQLTKEQIKFNMRPPKIKINQFNKNKSSVKNYEPEDPLLKICDYTAFNKYKDLQKAIHYKKNPKFIDRLKYVKDIDRDQSYDNIRIHNHLPNNGLLGNKKAMFYNIRQFCKLTRQQLSQYIPVTFHIKNGFLDQEYKAMSEMYNERKKKNLPNYWIIKPGQFSNRGQGISCTNKLQQIRKRITKCKQITNKNKMKKTSSTKSVNTKNATLIVQLYIHNPLLYNYRKFDIRAFMMVTIHNGKIKGYWYQQGYIRTSSFIWTLSQIQDKYIHLTNDAVQKNCQQYGMFEPGNKISYTQLQRYLHTLPSQGRNLDFFNGIYPKMRKMATDLIKSTFLNLDADRKRDNFELFGLDFMIDQNFKPWLIQVNTNPCLQMSCPILERIVPYMIENVFRIAVDPLFPPPSSISNDYKYAIPQNALHYNKFQLIFDEDRDGLPLKKLYKDSTVLKQLDDFEEDQQLFESQGQIMDFGQI